MKSLKWAAIVSGGVASLGIASAASATIVNIGATGFTDITLGEGRYLVTVIGTAEGGAYNGWNDHCPTGACSSGWSEAFIAESPSSAVGDEIDIFGLGATYASALDALQATQSSSTISHDAFRFGIPNSLTPLAPEAYPLVVEDQGLPTRLAVATTDGVIENNFGGVSLDVVPVPEPAAWAMMITGFGLVGSLLRGRTAGKRLVRVNSGVAAQRS